jgi:CRP-like cAMP-binding protein
MESVIALEPSVVVSIDKENFKKILLEQPQINTVVNHIMVKRRMQLEKRFEKLIFMDSRSRILEFLINLAEKEGRAVGFEKEVKINLTHQDIAELNFTSRQKVTILMNELKSKKIISFNRRRILFRDLDQLRTELRPSLLVTSE